MVSSVTRLPAWNSENIPPISLKKSHNFLQDLDPHPTIWCLVISFPQLKWSQLELLQVCILSFLPGLLHSFSSHLYLVRLSKPNVLSATAKSLCMHLAYFASILTALYISREFIHFAIIFCPPFATWMSSTSSSLMKFWNSCLLFLFFFKYWILSAMMKY